ncbi:MAG: hypothetical protein ACO4CS_17150 [bacterium]
MTLQTATTWDQVCWANQTMDANGVRFSISSYMPGKYSILNVKENGSVWANDYFIKGLNEEQIINWIKENV